tara:strand:+ start:1388 stop:1816 length:429 start_codon:yes stop_codon:yes gene_type:complete
MSDKIKNIYSKVQQEVLLHKIIRKEIFLEVERKDISADSEFLQMAVLKMSKGKTFRPHKHIYKQFNGDMIAQESWVVISGKVKVILYDLDDSIIEVETLNPGDVSMTFKGGHNYEVLEDNTFVYEYKTGPYMGQSKDKQLIE